MVEPRLGGPRAEGEGQFRGPVQPAELPALQPDFRFGRPTLPESLETLREGSITRADELDREIQELSQQIPGSIERVRTAPTTGGFTSPLPGQTIGGMFGQFAGQQIFGATPTEEENRLQEEQLTSQVNLLVAKQEELYTAVWQGAVLNALPVWIEAGLVESPADVMALSRSGLVATQQDIEFAANAIMQINTAKENKEREAEIFAEGLAEGGGSLSELLAINPAAVSAQELVNDLVSAGQFSLPPELSIEEVRSMLVSIGFSDAEADAQLFDAATEAFRLQSELSAYNARAEQLIIEGRKIGGGELVSQIKTEQWLRAASQPAQAILRPLEWYNNKVSKPLFVAAIQGGEFTKNLPGLKQAGKRFEATKALVATPGLTLAEQFSEFEAIARSEGAGKWEAKALAFDEWEADWWVKMLAEGAGDPFTLVGFGIYTKIFKPLPFVGTAVKHTEHAFNYMGEIPFRGLSAAWRRTVPRTLQQRGQSNARRFIDQLTHVMGTETNFRAPFRQTRPEQLRNLVNEAIDQAVTNPQAIDNFTGVGQQLVIHQPFEVPDLQRLFSQLGIDEDLVPISSELLSEFNRAWEKSSIYGVGKFFDTDRVAQYISQRVLGLGDDASTRIVRNALKARSDAGVKAARATLNPDSFKDQIFAMVDHISDGFVRAQRSGIRNARYQSGLVGAMLDGLDVATRAIWMEKVDRFVTQKIARAYLVFGFYSVANIAEAAAKTMFAGVNPIFNRTAVYDQLGVRAHALRGVPLNLSLPGKGGFDLSLAMPIEELRVLAQARKAPTGGSIVTRPFKRLVQHYVASYNEGRVLRSFGNDLQTAFGYNLGTQITNAQLANYLSRIFYKSLTQAAPEHIAAAGRVVDDVTRVFDGVLDEKVAEAYRESLFDYMLTGNKELLDDFTKTFTPGRVHAGEISKALDKYVELPTDIKDMFASGAESGILWGDMQGFRDVFEERILQHYLSSPEVFESSFREMFDSIFSEPVRGQVDLNLKLDMIRNTLEVFDDMTHNSLKTAISYSRNVRSGGRSDVIFESVWTGRILPNLEKVTFGIEDAARELRQSLGSDVFVNMPQIQKDKYDLIIDQLTAKAKIYQNARINQNEVRVEHFQRGRSKFVPVDQRDKGDFWDGYFREVDQVWEDARAAIHGRGGVNQQLLGASISLDQVSLPPLEDLGSRGISRSDVARMYGINAADLERSVYLTDIMAIQGKDNFIDASLMRAEMMAQQSGRSAEELGWTREAVASVYDGIADKMMANPNVSSGVEPLMIELEGAFQDVQQIGFRRNALMSDEKMKVVEQAVADLQERIRGKPLAPDLIKDGVQFVPEVRGGTQLALPSGEAQIARRNSIVRQRLSEDKAELESVQAVVTESINAIRDRARRDFNSASTRLGRMRDRGVDIRQADAALNRFGAMRDSGQSAVIRTERVDAWDEFISTLNTLNIDVEATLDKRAVELGKEFLLPGQPGAAVPEEIAPRGTQGFIDNLVEAGLPEDNAALIAGKLQVLGGQGKQFTRASLGQELGPGVSIRGRNIVDELERLGIIVRSGEGRFRLQGETARGKIVSELVREEQFPGGPELVFNRKTLRTFHGANEPADWVLRDIYDPAARLTGRPLPLGAKVTGNWQEIRQAAFDEANARRVLDFPDYENQTAFSYAMKAVYPFWGYEAHRWAWWLPREAIRHPGLWTSWGKYTGNTDQGYINVPNLPLDINPLRGNIVMGGFRQLQQRDYPEYYDNFKGVSEVFDYGTRWGFYPGFPVAAIMAGWGAKSGGSQWGELLPPLARNAFVDIPSTVAPEPWERVRQVLFPDRYRDFLIATEVSRLDFGDDSGTNGMELMRKKLLGESFTQEEDEIWARAARGIAVWSLLMEQTGLFRFRPEEKTQVYRDINEIISQEMGIPIPQLEDLRRSGLRVEDVFGPLSLEARRRINFLDRGQRFAGGSLALLPSEIGRSQALVNEFWATVEDSNNEARLVLLDVERDFLAGRRSYAQWEAAFVTYVEGTGSIIDSLKKTDQFEHVPVTQTERLKVAEETGIKIFPHPLVDLKTLYFDKELGEVYDEETGQIVKDFDNLFLYRDVITQSLGDKDAQDFQEFRRQNDTPLTALRFEVNKQYFRPYKNLRDVILHQFEPSEQRLIREFLAQIRLLGGKERAEEIRGLEFAQGDTTLIAEYNGRVSKAKQNLRIVDPELDAWLNVFGEAFSFQTAEARSRAEEITRQLQVGNLSQVLR